MPLNILFYSHYYEFDCIKNFQGFACVKLCIDLTACKTCHYLFVSSLPHNLPSSSCLNLIQLSNNVKLEVCSLQMTGSFIVFIHLMKAFETIV